MRTQYAGRVDHGYCLIDRDGTITTLTRTFAQRWERCTGSSVGTGTPLVDAAPCGEGNQDSTGPSQAIVEALERARSGTDSLLTIAETRETVTQLAVVPFGEGILLSTCETGSPGEAAAFVQSEAHAAKVASRLQAVLASAVDLDSSIQDAETIYRTTLENLSAAIHFDTGTIQLLDGEELHVVAQMGFDDPAAVMNLRFPLDERFPNHWVIRGRTSLALDDIRVDFPHFLAEEGNFESGHIRTWMGVPLTDRGQVIGMVTMDRTEIDPFDPDEIELSQALANHAAVALSNARMYQSLQKANDLQHMLLRELHHRVKNNLQLVSSLLNLRSGDVEGPARSIIDELRIHVQALAATHDNLFQPGLSEDVLVKPYVEDIVGAVKAGYIAPGRRVSVTEHVEPGEHLSMDLAVPLGLIVSELVLNAVKHGFDDGMEGTISVSVSRSPDGVVTVVEDDGVGFAMESSRHGFGLTLVKTLADQIRANLVHSAARPGAPRPGSRWTITVAS